MMPVRFRYRQKNFLKVFFLLVFAILPLATNSAYLYTSVVYYLIFVGLEALFFTYFLTKRLIVTDRGIERRVLGVSLGIVNWQNMVEAEIIAGEGKSPGSGFQQLIQPFSAIRWFAEKNTGIMMKIIVANDVPIYLTLKDIKESAELEKILKQKLRFVRPRPVHDSW
jgi:hypothetical protein